MKKKRGGEVSENKSQNSRPYFCCLCGECCTVYAGRSVKIPSDMATISVSSHMREFFFFWQFKVVGEKNEIIV